MKNPFGKLIPLGTRTYFASPERAAEDEMKKVVNQVISSDITKAILEAVGGLVVVLNQHRQVLAASPEILRFLDLEGDDCIIGLRPGEMLNCIHFTQGPGGCGTSKHCRSCGAVSAILRRMEADKSVESECLLSMERNGKLESVEFKVKASPLIIGQQELTAFILHDISTQKRVEVLERKFQQEFIETLTGIKGFSELLNKDDPLSAAQQIVNLTEILTRQIDEQHILFLAEQGTLEVKKMRTHASPFFENFHAAFSSAEILKDKHLIFQKAPDDADLFTDIRLMRIVLWHMIKNALEAVDAGETVTVWFERKDSSAGIVVYNPGVISEDISLQIFQRSFSTKREKGRGLGTYMMKLIGEGYLGGTVDFKTSETEGTRFSIFIPVEKSGDGKPLRAKAGPIDDSDNRISIEEASKALEQLPDQLIERIVEVTTMLDHDQLLRLLEEVEGYHRKLAEGLRQLAESYAYDRLMEIFNHKTI